MLSFCSGFRRLGDVLVKKSLFSLFLLLTFVFNACSFEENYQLTVCEDRTIQLMSIQSAEDVSLVDEADRIQPTEGELRIDQFFEQPSNQELTTLTETESNANIFWQEDLLPLSVLQASCYENNFNCFRFESPHETLLTSQVTPQGPEDTPQITLEIDYLNETGEERRLIATLNFIVQQTVLDLIQFNCNMNCENATNSLLADNLVNRVCFVDCENGQTATLEYTSSTDLFANRDDIAVFNQFFEPNCQLQAISAELPEIMAPFSE